MMTFRPPEFGAVAGNRVTLTGWSKLVALTVAVRCGTAVNFACLVTVVVRFDESPLAGAAPGANRKFHAANASTQMQVMEISANRTGFMSTLCCYQGKHCSIATHLAHRYKWTYRDNRHNRYISSGQLDCRSWRRGSASRERYGSVYVTSNPTGESSSTAPL